MARYEFVIKNGEGGSGNYSGTPRSSDKGVTPTKNSSKPLIKGVSLYGMGKSLINSVISHNINIVSLRTGQEEMQERLSYGYKMATMAFGAFENIAIGAMTGGLLGAGIGAIYTFTSYGLEVAKKQATIDLSRSLENISIGMANIRAGANGNRAVTKY